MCEYFMAFADLNSKSRVGQRVDHGSLNGDHFFLGNNNTSFVATSNLSAKNTSTTLIQSITMRRPQIHAGARLDNTRNQVAIPSKNLTILRSYFMLTTS